MSKNSGKSNTNTTTTVSQPPQQYLNAYTNLTNAAFAQANAPLAQYTGPMVAGFTPQQQQGFQTIQNLQGSYAPYLNAAAQQLSQATAPIWSTLPSFDVSQIPQGALNQYNAASGYANASGSLPIGQQVSPYASNAANTANGLAGAIAPYTGLAGGVASNLPGQVSSYANFAQGTASGLPGQVSPYTGLASGIASNLPGQVSPYTSFAQSNASRLPGQAKSYANLANTAAASAPANISTFENPYTKNVTNSLTNLFNQQNATQLAQQRGNLVGQGAYGGDRQAVSEALLAQQQNLAQAPTLANVQQQGYAQALQAAQAQAGLQAQTGLGAGQLTTQARLGAGQLGLGAGQLATQAGLGAGQLGLGAGQLTTQTGLGAGQLGLGAGQLTTQAGLGAGQLGLGAGQLTSQTGLGAANANLGAGQLTGQSLAQQGQLGLGAGQLSLGAGQGLFNEFNQQQSAQQQAEQANRWLSSQAGFGLASLGSQAQQLGLQGAQANIGAGTLQQQLAQQQLNIPYEQYQQQQAYPYQQLNFLAPIVEGTGSLSGGMSSITPPRPSTLSQVAGLGLAGAGIVGATGGFGSNGWLSNLFSGGEGDWSSGHRGGRVGLAAGGFPGIGMPGPGIPGGSLHFDTGVPDITIDIVPALGSLPGVHSPIVSQFQQPIQAASTTSSDGGGGGSVLGTLGSIAGIAKLVTSLKGGGRSGLDDGGGVQAPLDAEQPMSPLMDAGYQHYAALPEEKLQELSVQVPQGTPQGRMIQKALMSKRMNYLPLSGQPQMSQGGSADEYVSEDEMDDHPIIDHSGDTIVIRYPSEGEELDLGVPTMKRLRRAAGGLLPSETPPPAAAIPTPPPVSTTFHAGEPATHTKQTPPDQKGFSFSESPTGIAIPTMNQTLFSPPGSSGNDPADPGGGLGSWFNPLQQLPYSGPSAFFPSKFGFSTIGDGGGGGGGMGSSFLASAGSFVKSGGRARHNAGGLVSLDHIMDPEPTVVGLAGGGRARRGLADGGPPDDEELSAPTPMGLEVSPQTLELLREHENAPNPYRMALPGTAVVAKGIEGAAEDQDKPPPEPLPAPKAAPPPSKNDVSGVIEDASRSVATVPPLAPKTEDLLPAAATPSEAASGSHEAPKATEPAPSAAAAPSSASSTATPSETKGGPEDKVVGTPTLGPVAKAISEKSGVYGVPSATALKFAQLESGMGTNLGTRGNIFQLGSPQWEAMGGGNMADLDTQVDRGLKYLAHDYEVGRSALGREPTEIEAYMVHQQGDAGGPALLKAPQGALAVDVLAPAYGGNRAAAQKAIISNAGDLSMTAQQFVDLQKSRLEGMGSRINYGATLRRGAAPSGSAPSGGASQAPRPSIADTIAIPESRQYEPGFGASPWLPLISAGLGIMGGRSPYAAENIGRGGLEGVKTAEQQEAQRMHETQLANEAANRQALLGIEKARLGETERYHGEEAANRQEQRDLQAQQIGLSRDQLDQKAAEFAQTLGLDYQKLDETKKRNIIDSVYKDEVLKIRQGLQEQGTWGYGQGPDPNDPNKMVGGSWFYPKYGGEPQFRAGMGAPKQTSSNNTFEAMRQAYKQVHGDDPNVEASALDFAAKKNGFRDYVSFANSVRAEKGVLQQQIGNLNKPDAELEAQARKNVLDRQGVQPGAAPAAPAAPRAASQQWTRENPLVPKTQADIDNAPSGSVIKTPNGMMVKP